ncbi:hypothetical protein, partial [Paraburkholderia caledonica]|uniref:hypothetical protein n=1 Tax=Paraburkholderia caledonica TaxID=134536 RepID=UPI001C4EBB9C
KQQPNPKPSWLAPYDELNEADKEADRQIGEAVAHWALSIKGAKWEVAPSVAQDEGGAFDLRATFDQWLGANQKYAHCHVSAWEAVKGVEALRAASTPANAPAPAQSAIAGTYPPCQGMNCGCTDGENHSAECFAEHAATIAGGRFTKGFAAAPAQSGSR